MADVRYMIGKVAIRPLECFQSIVAICLITLGLFLISPLYIPSAEFIQSADLATQEVFRNGLVSILFILPALSTVAGWFLPRFRSSTWRATGCFAMFVALLFACLSRIVIIGLVPAIWIFYLGMALVSAILYFHWKVN